METLRTRTSLGQETGANKVRKPARTKFETGYCQGACGWFNDLDKWKNVSPLRVLVQEYNHADLPL